MNEATENEMIFATDKNGCPTVSYQDVNVCVPVTIKAYGEIGTAKTQCLGKAIVSCGSDDCTEKSGNVCKFTISQNLRVEIPVMFDAKAEAGEAIVDCDCGE